MISRYVILLIALGALSCADAPEPAADRRPPAPAPPVVGGSSIRIVSVAGEPGGRGGAWNLGADQDTVQVRITLEGSGRAEVRAELFAPDGRSIHRVDRAVELDGVQEIDLSDLPVPEPGGYRLEVEVTAPGIRSSQSVTIKRG